jgi:NTE family protein
MARVGLVLGGGGIVGMAHHGAVLAGLQEATGWDPRNAEIVVGTSAGAASGSELRAGLPACDLAARRGGLPFSLEGERLLHSLGPPPQEQPRHVPVDAERIRASFRRVATRSMFSPAGVRPGVLAALSMPPGQLSTSWLERQTDWLNAGRRWPGGGLWLCALDLDRTRRVVFGRPDSPPASVGEAVAASCAIPGVFAPVEIDGTLYIDGGAWSATNADLLAGRELDLVIVSSPMTGAPGSVLGRRDGWIRAAGRSMLLSEVAAVQSRGTDVVIIEPTTSDLQAMGHVVGTEVLDEGRCDEVVRQVRASTRERVIAGRLPGLQRLSASPLDAAA